MSALAISHQLKSNPYDNSVYRYLSPLLRPQLR
jgi:hypothetical protein